MSESIEPDWEACVPYCGHGECPQYTPSGECALTDEAEDLCVPAVVRMAETLTRADADLAYVRTLYGDEGLTRSLADAVKAAMPPAAPGTAPNP